jgi:hypothetical protein
LILQIPRSSLPDPIENPTLVAEEAMVELVYSVKMKLIMLLIHLEIDNGLWIHRKRLHFILLRVSTHPPQLQEQIHPSGIIQTQVQIHLDLEMEIHGQLLEIE